MEDNKFILFIIDEIVDEIISLENERKMNIYI